MDLYETTTLAYRPPMRCKIMDGGGSFEIERIEPDGTRTRISGEEIREKARDLYRERDVPGQGPASPGNAQVSIDELVN